MTFQSLPLWRRIGLAFSTFFKILFDARFAWALSMRPVRPDSAPRDEADAELSPRPAAVAAARLASSADAGADAALVLLGLLQSEGRFVDFVLQDVGGFPDADVGAVARVVHAGCRKVLGNHLRIEAIRSEPEGQSVALEPGFDPNRIKLTGRVAGSGALRGTLRHRGWQATDVHLPSVVDRAGSRILCPAEVEL
jgi:hypothetical protein